MLIFYKMLSLPIILCYNIPAWVMVNFQGNGWVGVGHHLIAFMQKCPHNETKPMLHLLGHVTHLFALSFSPHSVPTALFSGRYLLTFRCILSLCSWVFTLTLPFFSRKLQKGNTENSKSERRECWNGGRRLCQLKEYSLQFFF